MRWVDVDPTASDILRGGVSRA